MRWVSIFSLGVAACTPVAAVDDFDVPEPAAVAAPAPATIPLGAPVAADAAAIPDDARIELARGACYGPCPIYRVVLRADGQVRWIGERHVRVHGERDATIDAAAFAALWRELHEQPLARLPDRFPDYPSPYCPSYATDHSSATVVVAGGGTERTVVDYHGCNGDPTLEAFRPLEDRIDAVAGSDRWVGRCRTQACRD